MRNRASSSADADGVREQLHVPACRHCLTVVYEGLYRVVDAWQEPESNRLACKCVQSRMRGSLNVLLTALAGSVLTCWATSQLRL